MAKKKKSTTARPVPGGQKALSQKIAKVKRDAKKKGESLTNSQAAGKAAGMLRHKARKKRKKKSA